MNCLFSKQIKRVKRHFSSLSSYSIHSRTHFGGAWGRRELKESPVHGPLIGVSPLKLLPELRVTKETKFNILHRGRRDSYLLFYCYHLIYCEELFYGHIAMLVIIAEGNGDFLVRLMKANRDDRLEITHFKFLKKLGSGSFGTVFLAKHPFRDELVAVKKILAMRMHKAEVRDTLRIMIEKEASCHMHGSPHVIKLFDTFTVSSGPNQAFYLVYEYIDGGDLSGLISRIHNGLSLKDNCLMFYEKHWLNNIENNPFIMLFTKYLSPQILLGVSALHERGIIHLDLKPDNILVTKQGIVKISDLGLVKRYRWFHYSARAEFLTSLSREVYIPTDQDRNYVAGTLPYMEPELRGKFIKKHKNIPENYFNYQVTYSADYFSVGIIIFEIMTGFIYGHAVSYEDPGMEHIYQILVKNDNLPLIALNAYKNYFPMKLYKLLKFFAKSNMFDLTNGKDEGIIDFLLYTCKPRKKRWLKYTIPIKVKRDGHKLEENILCIKKIQESIPLFKNVNFEALTFNGIPHEILEFLNTPEPLYNDFAYSDEVLNGQSEDYEDVYKWPYFDFHLPPEEEHYYCNISSKNLNEKLTSDEINILKDKGIRNSRSFGNTISQSESFMVNNDKDEVTINVYHPKINNIDNYERNVNDDIVADFFS